MQMWLRNPTANPTIDFNGYFANGAIVETRDEWGMATFEVPIEHVEFSQKLAEREVLKSVHNTIYMASGSESGDEFACADIGGVSMLVTPAPLPVLMFHKLHPFGDATVAQQQPNADDKDNHITSIESKPLVAG